MGVGYNPRIVTNGLVLCLDAGNRRSYPGSGTAWTDLSGGNNTGTLTNGPTFSSGNGGSIVFDGTNDYVNVPFNTSIFPSGTAARTLAAFINPSAVKDQAVFGVGGNSGSGSRLNLYLRSTSQIGFECVGAGKFVAATTSTWYYLAVVLPSGGTTVNDCLLYLNGVLRTDATFVGSNFTINTTTDSCVVGTIPAAAGNENLQGSVGNASLYNRALSAAEIRQNFNALRGRYGI